MTDTQEATQWRGFAHLPDELRYHIYELVVTREFKAIITSKKLRGSHVWSGFCRSICVFGPDILAQYRGMLVERIARNLNQVHVNVKDFRFGSLTSTLKTVEAFPEAQRFFTATRAVTNRPIGASPFSMAAPPQTVELRARPHFAVNLIFSDDFVFDMNPLASFYRTASTYIKRQRGHVHGHFRAMYEIRYTNTKCSLKETPAWRQMVRTFDWEDKPAGQAFFIASAIQDFAARPTREWELTMELGGLNGFPRTTGVNERLLQNTFLPFYPLWLEEQAELPDVLTPKTNCPICLDDKRVDLFSTLLVCGHRFCHDCINEWHGRQSKTTCVFCRRDIWQNVEEGDWKAAIDGHVPNPLPQPGGGQVNDQDGADAAGLIDEEGGWQNGMARHHVDEVEFERRVNRVLYYDGDPENAGSDISDSEMSDGDMGEGFMDEVDEDAVEDYGSEGYGSDDDEMDESDG